MKNSLILGIAAALIIATGVVHGFWTNEFDFILGKPSASEQRQVFADRLNKNVPDTIGQWVSRELPKMDARVQEIANVDASLEREYNNVSTGVKSSVFIVSGHFRDVAVHTPDQCYVAAGYDMMSEPIKYKIPTPAGELEAYTTVFKKEDSQVGTHYLRVFWTWSFDGKWVAPDSPRIEFVGQPALYKMYIISQLAQPGRSIAEDPSIPFVGQFLPVLNDALFPGEVTTGADPADALEPAGAPQSPIAPKTEAPAAVTPPATAPAETGASQEAKPGS